MVTYLHSIGVVVAYVECNGDKNHLEMLRQSYPGYTAVNKNRFARGGVIYLKLNYLKEWILLSMT